MAAPSDPNAPAVPSLSTLRVLGGAARLTLREDRRGYNVASPAAGAVPSGAPEVPTRLAVVTHKPPDGSYPNPATGPGLYKIALQRLLYNPAGGTSGAVNWEDQTDAEECWLAPRPGQTFDIGDPVHVTAVDDYLGLPIFATVAGQVDLSCYPKFSDFPCEWPVRVRCDPDTNQLIEDMFTLRVPENPDCEPCQDTSPPPVPPGPPVTPPPVPPSPPSPPPVPPPPPCRYFAAGWYKISRNGLDSECFQFAGGPDPANPSDCTTPAVEVPWTGVPGLIAVRAGPFATQGLCQGYTVSPQQTVAYTSPGWYAVELSGTSGGAPFAARVDYAGVAAAYTLRDGPYPDQWMVGPARFAPLAPAQPDAAAQQSYLDAHQAQAPVTPP